MNELNKETLKNILNTLKEIEEEQILIDKEIKNVKKEVLSQLEQQKINFSNSLSDFEKKTKENINQVIELMKEKMLKEIGLNSNSIEKPNQNLPEISEESQSSNLNTKDYSIKIFSQKNNIKCKKSELENQRITFIIENIGNKDLPQKLYLKSENSTDETILLNQNIKEELKKNKKIKIETFFKIVNFSDSPNYFETDIKLFHNEIKNINQMPFHFTINFLEEDNINQEEIPLNEDDFNYIHKKINEIIKCDEKTIKEYLSKIYNLNKNKYSIIKQYKENKEELFDYLINIILSSLIPEN